jgi:hypothetical protein
LLVDVAVIHSFSRWHSDCSIARVANWGRKHLVGRSKGGLFVLSAAFELFSRADRARWRSSAMNARQPSDSCSSSDLGTTLHFNRVQGGRIDGGLASSSPLVKSTGSILGKIRPARSGRAMQKLSSGEPEVVMIRGLVEALPLGAQVYFSERGFFYKWFIKQLWRVRYNSRIHFLSIFLFYCLSFLFSSSICYWSCSSCFQFQGCEAGIIQ